MSWTQVRSMDWDELSAQRQIHHTRAKSLNGHRRSFSNRVIKAIDKEMAKRISNTLSQAHE